MVLVNLKSRTGVVNLFADYVLTKIGSNTKTVIQVTDCNHFFVVNGKTEEQKRVNLTEITKSFEQEFYEYLSGKTLNTVDLIEYEMSPPKNNNIWFTFFLDESLFYIKKIVERDFQNDPLQISSEYPFGYSKIIDRNKLYYSEYICNQLKSVITSKTVKFKFSEDVVDDSNNIEIICDSMYEMQTIKSMVLDVFDFDLDGFNKKIISYDVIRDLTFPTESKPWLKSDLKKDMWLF